MLYDTMPDFQPEEVLIYLRKSRSDDPLLTVEEVLLKHEKMLDEWSERHLGGLVPQVNRFREVVSGETIEHRPEIQRILRMIESSCYKAVLVVEVQRLSRGDLEDAGRLMKLLRYTGTAVITPQKVYDLQNEYDRDFFERELKRGNEFLEYTKKIMNRGRLASVREGHYIGSVPPYGYDRCFVQEGKRKYPTLKVNEKEAEAVRMMYELYVHEGLNYMQIAQRLNELGYRPRKIDSWTRASVKDMLANEHYVGMVRWNWRREQRVVEDGELLLTRPKQQSGDYLVFPGKHEAIVSEELFHAAQQRMNLTPRVKKEKELRNPLAGLLYCRCGKPMMLQTYEHKKNPPEPRLTCVGQAKCGTSSCTYSEIIDHVSVALSDCIADFEVRLRETSDEAAKRQEMQVAMLEERLQELEKKEVSQWEKYAEDGMPKTVFDVLNAKVLKEKEEVSQALSQAKAALPDRADYETKLHHFRGALAALAAPDLPAKKKNRLLKVCLTQIVYSREKSVRLKRAEGEAKGERFKTAGGRWKSQPIQLDLILKI